MNEMIGLPKETVISFCQLNMIDYRISREDDQYYILTRDYKPNRVNLSFENNILVDYRFN